ncbi:uncharacterized protein LOC122379356 isoform X2 [Amphibalanus amphitrite]|uniref:uncharacterized protein LOC122379356 isoform X2 n=1 Tax=Amphibalanus amphitrite TaxID=1232801 RepID=UPI001C901D2F|nr:uncharacterized protein LOC122379356 isoform X2 [Amphibalanus amphitrite]
MFNHLLLSTSIAFCIFVISLHCGASAQDYDNDAYPDEDNRIGDSASISEAERSHRDEKREDDSQPLGMKTSTVIEISADDAKSTKKENEEEATVSHTPNTKLQAPITVKKTPKVITKGKGKEKTVLSQKLPQKPSRVVVDVKEKKDKNDPKGKKKWETDLVVEGKAKKVEDEDDTEVISDSGTPPEEEVIDVQSSGTKTEEIIDVEGGKEEVIEVEPVTESSEEVIEVVKPPKPPEPKVIEVIEPPGPRSKGDKVVEVIEPSGAEEIVEVATTPPETPEVIEIESAKNKNGDVVIEEIVPNPEDIDIENMGKNNKVTTAIKEGRHEILEDIKEGLTPDLLHWAEEAIAAGIENVVNAVEDKYIAYMKSRTRRKREAASSKSDDGDDDDEIIKTSSKTLHAAMKKVQKAAAVLASSEARNAAKAASTAAKLNMDVTSQAASNAMKSVASAIGAASQNAAKQIVDAENQAAAAALAGAAPVIVAGAQQSSPVIVTDSAAAPAAVEEAVIEAAARPPPVIVTENSPGTAAAVEQAAAASGSGRDLIQQTLQIQKGLNLVMRAVLKEKERVAADLARYQNKISFLLREMTGAAAAEAGAAGRRRRREVRRQRRALLTTEHLHQLLQREQHRVNQMLHLLDVGISTEKRKRAAPEAGACRSLAKKRSGGSRESQCVEVG